MICFAECTQLTEARLGLQTDSGHLEACDVNSHLPRARKNPFNFILNLFKSKRTEKSLKAKFVHEENVESEQFSSDSVFDDSNENNLETTNLNIGEVQERPLCQGGACSRGRGCRNKNVSAEEVISSPDGGQVPSTFNGCDTQRPHNKSDVISSPEHNSLLSLTLNVHDLKRPRAKQGFGHSVSEHHRSTQNCVLLDSTQRLVISRSDNPRVRRHATSDWDTEDTVLTPSDRFESDSNRHLIRSPPPMLKYDTNSPSRRQGEKTDPVGGAMDKLSMRRSDGSPLTSCISKVSIVVYRL